MTNDLRAITREAIRQLEGSGQAAAAAIVEPVRAALAERGLGPRCKEGDGPFTDEETVEWYAGQLLDIVDTGQWFAVNSIVNTVDKFCPAQVKS